MEQFFKIMIGLAAGCIGVIAVVLLLPSNNKKTEYRQVMLGKYAIISYFFIGLTTFFVGLTYLLIKQFC